MGHFISGIVADFSSLKAFATSHNLHVPARLVGDLGFLPLSDDHLDSLYPTQGDFDPSMTYLSASLKNTISELSADGPVAFVETEYFGGDGAQGATVYDQGRCVMPAVTEESGPISRAMSLLGVTKLSGHTDEFQSAGFGRHRNNEDWIEEAKMEVEPVRPANPPKAEG
jgi:hypothetical protein